MSDYGDTLALNRIFHQQQQKACTHYVHKDDYNSHQQRHNVLVYMALPSQLFGVAAQAVQTAMHNAGIVVQHQPKGAAAVAFVRLILEKPFGRDTSSCLELMKTLQQQQNWKECDLYRIDHYLGKESVRNILPLRRHLLQQQQTVHPALKPKINWNRHGIAAVHLVSHEPFGIDGRGGYFDSYGIIRDMIQNHLLQILTLIGMDLLPDNVDDDDDDWVRSSKVNVLKQIPIIQSSDCLLGQYNGYVNDDSIANTSSRTSTYACLRAWIDNDSWKGVPFVLEAGKALDEKLCEARIYLRNDGASMSSRDRMLVIRIQPSPSVQIITTPCYDGTAAGRRIDSYPTQSLSASSIVEGTEYAKLILDAIRGRRAHFVRNDELLEAWRIFTPLLHELDEADSTLHTPERYEPSSSGPVGRLAFLRAMGIPLDVPSRSAL